MKDTKVEFYFFLVFFLVILGLTFLLFLPFLGALAVAMVLAIIFAPVHEWLVRTLRFRGLAALLSVLAVLIVVFLPLSFIAFLLFGQAQDLFVSLNSGGSENVSSVLAFLESKVNEFVPGFSLDIESYAREGLNWITQSLGGIFAGTAQAVLAFVIGLISLFYFFRDGEWFRNIFVKYSPLRDTYDNEIVERVKLTVNSILRGSLLVALIQGTLSGIGFALFGVPNAILWGSIAALGALIPGVGTAIVFAPAIVYLFFIGGAAPALGLLAWGALAVGLIDNFLGPILIGRGIKIHPLLILLSVIGGLKFFGPVGFLLGPIVFSLLLVLAEIHNVLLRHARSDG